MLELLIGGALWIALDAVLLALWIALGQRHRRRQIRAMVHEAELYANTGSARPLVAALNSGHAEDAEIRHARQRSQARQGEIKPL